MAGTQGSCGVYSPALALLQLQSQRQYWAFWCLAVISERKIVLLGWPRAIKPGGSALGLSRKGLGVPARGAKSGMLVFPLRLRGLALQRLHPAVWMACSRVYQTIRNLALIGSYIEFCCFRRLSVTRCATVACAVFIRWCHSGRVAVGGRESPCRSFGVNPALSSA